MKLFKFPLNNYAALCALAAFGLASSARAQSPAAAAPASSAPEYRLGAGDVIDVDVWKEPGASASKVLVRADGKITLPLVKEVDVDGQTPSELEKVLVQKLAKFIPGAEVTVVVKEGNSKKVFLTGAVKKEGAIALHGPMTVLQVLAEGGGMTEYAKRKKIYVLRGTGANQVKLPFNYKDVVRGKHAEQNVQVMPGDTIVVPQ